MSKSPRVGMHIRLASGLQDVIKKAEEGNMPWFQSFLINQRNECLIVSDEQKKEIYQGMQQFEKRFVHASYWLNLCNPSKRSFQKALYECEFGLELGFTHMVLHPGAVLKQQERDTALKILAENLNKLADKFPDLTILLENAAHSKRAIGGSLEELAQLYSMVEKNSGICIDTSHAYVYGYDIADSEKQKEFLHDIKRLFPKGIDLLHLNDASRGCGSYIDCHEIPGKGFIGMPALKAIAQDNYFKDTPIILEVSCESDEEESCLIQEIEQW